MLHDVIGVRCVARDLHRIVAWPLERTYCGQFAAQRGICKNLDVFLSMRLLLLSLLIIIIIINIIIIIIIIIVVVVVIIIII